MFSDQKRISKSGEPCLMDHGPWEFHDGMNWWSTGKTLTKVGGFRPQSGILEF